MKEIAQNTFVIEGPTNVGVIITGLQENEVILVDTGGSSLDGERIHSELADYFASKSQPYTVKAIYNTHSHADHCGGNAFLKQKYGCEIYIPFPEQGSVENSLLQSSIIWGGYPIKDLRTIYYTVEYAEITGNFDESTKVELSHGMSLSFVSLPGHYYSTYGIVVSYEDDSKVIFAGDSIFGRQELGKYWIPFILNPKDYLTSLDKLPLIKNLKLCIPGHGEFIGDELEETIELNKIAVLSTTRCILDILQTGEKTTEQIIKIVADKNEITMKQNQFLLIGCTIRSYLSNLMDDGKIKNLVKENMLYWALK